MISVSVSERSGSTPWAVGAKRKQRSVQHLKTTADQEPFSTQSIRSLLDRDRDAPSILRAIDQCAILAEVEQDEGGLNASADQVRTDMT
ncbi:MAG: hypothetical protein IPP33_08310 [Flavobacteriales bacterium]|nr:hypothetical protein [Flavobacteriales bacterium]